MLALAFCLCGAWAMAALPPMPERLDREKALERVAQASRTDAPDANTLTVAQAQWTEYAEDGRDTVWAEFWSKALTEPGAQELRTVPLWFKQGYSISEFQLAEVIHADGSATPIDLEANVAEASSNSGNDANIYDPTSRRLMLSVPKIEVGDTLHVILCYRTLRPRIPDSYYETILFQSFGEPVPYSVATVVSPKALPLKSVALLDEVPGTVTASRETLADGRTLHRWVARGVPQAFAEPKMPDTQVSAQRVSLSTFDSWEALSKWYWALCDKHMRTTPAIDAKVAALTQGKDRAAQIEALFAFVAQEVRYMGIIAEDEAPGFEPHDVALTFDNRYGVCRDKGVLLVAMLRKAGFDAFPVIIHAGSPRDAEVPMPYFNHAVVAIDEGDRQYRLLDPTDDTARAEFPAYLSGCSYLVARPEGETLRETPIPDPEGNMALVETTGTLDAAGNLDLTSTIRLDGVNDNVYRGFLVRSQPERIRDVFDGLLKRAVPGAELIDLAIEPKDPRDISHPLTLRLDARVPDYAVPDAQGHVIATLPFVGRRIGMINFLFDGLAQPTRVYDWVIEAPCGVRETLTLRGLGRLGTPELLPDDPILKANGASFDMVCRRADNGDLSLTRELVLSHKVYTPEDYRALRRFAERMDRIESLRPLFRKPPAQNADAEILASAVETTLAPDGTSRRRTVTDSKILTFQGKRALGEVKIYHNPDFETLTLSAVEVASAKGDRVPISKKEISELDVDGAALAPRYAALRETVLSLPAIDVGAVSHVDVTIASADPRPFSETHVFGAGPYPTHETRYTLTLPLGQDARLRVAERNFPTAGVSRSVVTNGTQVTRTWILRDLPAVKPEPDPPAATLIRPTLRLALPEAAAHRVLPGVIAQADALLDNADLDDALAAIPGADADDPEARLRAIQAFMATRIREAGTAWEALRLATLTPPATTLADGYGNRLDRLILQLGLLRAADLDARLVFASANSLQTEVLFGKRLALREVPDWTRWTRPYILLADGRLVGDEGELDEPGSAAVPSCSLMSAEGRLLYDRPDALRTRAERTLKCVVTPEGDAILSSETLSWGRLAGAVRTTERDLTPEHRRRAIATLAESLAPGAEPVSQYTVDTRAYPVRSRLSVEAKGYAQRRGRLLSVPVQALLGPRYGLRGVNRENPIWQGGEEGTRARAEFWLPKGSEILSKPEPFAYALPGGGALTLTCSQERHPVTGIVHLTYELTCANPPALLDAWTFPALTELDRRLAAPTQSTIFIRLPE